MPYAYVRFFFSDGHSRAVRIALEIAGVLARPLTLPGVSKLLAAARLLMGGEQGARAGELLPYLRAAREASRVAASAVQGWQGSDDDSAWPSSAYLLVPEREIQGLRTRLRAPVDSQPTASGTPVVAADTGDEGDESHLTWPP